jgi:hypothetical protein
MTERVAGPYGGTKLLNLRFEDTRWQWKPASIAFEDGTIVTVEDSN